MKYAYEKSKKKKQKKTQVYAILKHKENALTFIDNPFKIKWEGLIVDFLQLLLQFLFVCPSKFIYEQKKMGTHSTDCLINQTFTNFPLSFNTNWKKEKQMSQR